MATKKAAGSTPAKKSAPGKTAPKKAAGSAPGKTAPKKAAGSAPGKTAPGEAAQNLQAWERGKSIACAPNQ